MQRRARPKYPRATPYLFVLPFYLVFLPFGAGSLVMAVVMGFMKWPLGQPASFVGMANFQAVMGDALFFRGMGNTLTMLAQFLLILMPLAILLAVVMQGMRERSLNFVQVLVFAPVTMSLIAVSIIFDLLYDDRIGAINGLLALFNAGPVPFLSSADVAPWAIVAMRVWRVLGFYAIILYGGLQAIPTDIYEAAKIDGAGWWRTPFLITLPLLKPVTLFVLVAASVAAWELFAEPNVLTNGGPARSTYTAVMYIFEVSFGRFDIGRGAAASVLLGVVIVLTTLLLSRLLRTERA